MVEVHDGSGEDDMVPATLDGEQDVLLTEGEFVIRQPTTEALEEEFGNGFLDVINQAEDDAPKKLKEMVGYWGLAVAKRGCQVYMEGC